MKEIASSFGMSSLRVHMYFIHIDTKRYGERERNRERDREIHRERWARPLTPVFSEIYLSKSFCLCSLGDYLSKVAK